jgi:hypothetical protein
MSAVKAENNGKVAGGLMIVMRLKKLPRAKLEKRLKVSKWLPLLGFSFKAFK